MKLDFSNERLLAVVAHPDDAELLCAGTLARAKSEGATVGICVLCRGDKGQPNKPVANLVAVRRREMTASARLLGAQLFLAGFSDGSVADNEVQRRVVLEMLRRFKPTLVLAHAPEDYHPDHRAASSLTEAASWFCASRGHKTRSPALSAPPEVWWMDTLNMSGFDPGFYVDISAHVTTKIRMLACHKSQLGRGTDSDFEPLNEVLQVQARARGNQAGVAAAEAFRGHYAFKRGRAW